MKKKIGKTLQTYDENAQYDENNIKKKFISWPKKITVRNLII